MRSKFKWIFTLLLAFSMQFSFAQEKTITGVVSDQTGPLPGASVVVQGTTRGTQTDIDGRYSINASAGETLVISFVGYNEFKAVVGASNSINASLQEGIDIGEVVVTGALNIKRKANAVTSSYAVVNSETLNQANNPNAVQALVGKISGLQINNVSNGVNGGNTVVFRGARTMTGSNQALVVIDGAISSIATFSQIPPAMIENVTALKGAQGAALYGSDGVNGVIVVTTKRGSAGGKFTVNVTNSTDFSSVSYLPQKQLRYGQGWSGRHAVQENGSWGPEFDGSMQPVGLPQADGSFVTLPYVGKKDNIKEFFKTGVLYQNGVSISGGSLDEGYTMFSANRTVNDFVIQGDELKRNSFLFKAGKKMGKFTVEGNVNYITQSVRQAESDLYGQLLQTPSNVDLSRFDSGVNENHWTVYYLSPYFLRDNNREETKFEKIAGIVTLNYEINKNINIGYLANLRLTTSSGMSYRNGHDEQLTPIWGNTANNILSNYYTNTAPNRSFYGDLTVNFDYMLTDDISFRATVGNNVQDIYTKTNQVGGTNLEIPGFYNFRNVLNPDVAGALTNTYTQRRKMGLFANVDLGYKNFLYLNLTGRNDWSSAFAKGNDSFFYPSVGLSFVPTNAFKDLKGDILNDAKIIANFTRVGNDSGVGTYGINQLGVLGIGYPFGGQNSYVQQTQQVNAAITPEFVTTKEVGLSLGFLKNRVTLDASYYITDTKDLITNTSASAASGLFRNQTNIGEMETKGFDIDLGFAPFRSSEEGGFRWDVNVNFTKYESIIKKVSDEADQVNLRAPYDWVGVFAEVGQEFPLIKGSTFERDDQGRVIIGANGMPTIDPTLKTLGKVNPDYIVGLNTAFSYKGIRLSATMDYRKGGVFYSDVKRNYAWTGQLIESAENREGGFIMPNSSYFDAATSSYLPNTNAIITGATPDTYISYYDIYARTGENLVVDATAFKLRELALSYTLPKSLIDNTGIANMSIGVHGRNLFTWYPKQNRFYGDPENSEEGGAANAGGLSFADQYPTQRQYGFSLNLTF